MRKTGIVLCTAVLLLLFVSLSRAGVNEIEPNDTLNQATAFRIGDSAAGTLLRPPSDSKDTWRFSLDRDAKVSLDVTPSEGLSMSGVYIYNEHRSSYATFAAAGAKRTFTGYLKGGKTYYLELNGQGAAGAYTITSQAEYPARDAEKEPNDVFDTATVHTPSTTAYGHLLYTDIAATDTKDMWRFTLDRDARIVLDITPADGLTIGGAYIYNENRSSYAALAAKGNGKSATLYLQGGKTYYIEVNGAGSGGYYSLTTAVQYPTYGNELKGADASNDAMANATEITGGTGYGHLGYTDIRSTDTVDYWRFSLKEERCVDIRAEPVEGELAFASAYLYFGNRSTYNSFTADGRGFVFKKCLKPDTYYIELTGRNSGSYRLMLGGAGFPDGGTGRLGETEFPIQVKPPEQGRPETADLNLQNIRGKDLISNNVLKTALCGWDVVEWHKPSDGKGEVTYEADGVRFKSLSGNTRIGIRQDREADVSRCRRLVLSATVKVERQTLTGTGWNGREAPVGVFVSYTDTEGGVHNLLSENPADPKRMFWQGFYALDPVPPSLSHGTKVQQGTWHTYRVNLSPLKPARVHYIGAEGAGWSPRDAVIKDINLICEE